MLRWIVEWQGWIRSELNTLEGQQEWCKHPRTLQKNDSSGTSTKEEHIVRRMLDAATPGKEEEGGQTQDGRMRVREI